MKQTEFVQTVAKTHNLAPKVAKEIVDGIWELIAKAIKKGDEVAFQFGKFILKKRPARLGRNPMTGAQVKIAAKVVPQFKPSKKFKDLYAK